MNVYQEKLTIVRKDVLIIQEVIHVVATKDTGLTATKSVKVNEY